MNEKEYEMPDDYKQAVNQLLEIIKQRDELAEAVKLAPPDRIQEGQELLAELNKQIDSYEAALEREYQSHQTYMKALEAENQAVSEVIEKMQMVYVYYKHRLPDKLPELEATIFNGWSDEEIQNFQDGVAILEATRLEELIAEAPKDNE